MAEGRSKRLRRQLATYDTLDSTARALKGKKQKLSVRSLAATRSGNAIAGVRAGDAMLAVFKHGEKRKLKNERKGFKRWHALYPGLAPRVLSYQKRGGSAALLIDHVPGQTFEQLLLANDPSGLEAGQDCLERTIRAVWTETRVDRPSRAGFMTQLQERWPDVQRIHPEFADQRRQICGRIVPRFSRLMARAAKLEQERPAPFSVHIHGDFNLDNVIYDPIEQQIQFVDLHRSRYQDYVQDVSVFMVSHYRQQIFDPELRGRILAAARRFYKVARRHARKSGDASFEWRMALGLARSFATSTRFVLDKALARNMFLRARYLLERATETPQSKLADFHLPVRALFDV